MRKALERHVFRTLLGLLALVLGTGTVVYHVVEKFSWVDAYYYSVVTLATVGYGDFVPQTTFGKIFTTFYIFIGVGILGGFVKYIFDRRAKKIEQDSKSKD